MQPVIAARVRLLRQIGRSFVISFATSSTSIILIIRLPSSNPSVADRINCVNAKIANARGERRLVVNRRCVQLIKDLEQVWEDGRERQQTPRRGLLKSRSNSRERRSGLFNRSKVSDAARQASARVLIWAIYRILARIQETSPASTTIAARRAGRTSSTMELLSCRASFESGLWTTKNSFRKPRPSNWSR